MDMHSAKKEMYKEIMRMAGEARMKAMKAKYSPTPELAKPLPDEDTGVQPPLSGEHMPLSDEELKKLLED